MTDEGHLDLPGYSSTDQPDAEAMLHQLIDLVEGAKSMPLSASVLVSRDEVIGMLEAVLDSLPVEIDRARSMLRDREEQLDRARREAEEILEEARVQAERMVERAEVVRQAKHVAQRIVDDAREEARRLRHEAEDYCDQRLAAFEIVLERTAKTVQAGREKLHATLAALARNRKSRGDRTVQGRSPS